MFSFLSPQFCVICRTGDNESLLLLCDNCDRGTHTYCCKPKLESIPEGDWYCHDCVINVSPTKLFTSVARRIPITTVCAHDSSIINFWKMYY